MNNWILCSKRLPEKDGEYLVTVKAEKDIYFLDILGYAKDLYDLLGAEYRRVNGWYSYDVVYGYDEYSLGEVIAWMPLPEPIHEAEPTEE